jgi:hypothetical protein
VVDADRDDHSADGDDQQLTTGPGEHAAHRPGVRGGIAGAAEGDPGRRDGEEAVGQRRPDGLDQLDDRAPPDGAGSGQPAVVAEHLDGLPEAQPGEPRGQQPQQQRADGGVREQRHRPALVDGGVAVGRLRPSGLPGQLQRQPGDQQVQQRVADQADLGHPAQCPAVRGPVRQGRPRRPIRLGRHSAPRSAGRAAAAHLAG